MSTFIKKNYPRAGGYDEVRFSGQCSEPRVWVHAAPASPRPQHASAGAQTRAQPARSPWHRASPPETSSENKLPRLCLCPLVRNNLELLYFITNPKFPGNFLKSSLPPKSGQQGSFPFRTARGPSTRRKECDHSDQQLRVTCLKR